MSNRIHDLLEKLKQADDKIHRLECDGAFSLNRDPFQLQPMLEALQAGQISAGRARDIIRGWLAGEAYEVPERAHEVQSLFEVGEAVSDAEAAALIEGIEGIQPPSADDLAAIAKHAVPWPNSDPVEDYFRDELRDTFGAGPIENTRQDMKELFDAAGGVMNTMPDSLLLNINELKKLELESVDTQELKDVLVSLIVKHADEDIVFHMLGACLGSWGIAGKQEAIDELMGRLRELKPKHEA